MATFVDISAQKRTERSLQTVGRLALETQQTFRALMDHSAEMMIVSPFNGDRRFVSRAVEELTGSAPKITYASPGGISCTLMTVHGRRRR